MTERLTSRVNEMLAARLQVIATTLNCVEASWPGLPVLGDYWIRRSENDLDVFKAAMNESLGSLEEWQVSAYHDQYNVLKKRLEEMIARVS